ncbi:ABC transporter substrate-binding protein [Phenylobacterium immobile]|uniref:ABC transporter substrate-binding protein n=1 Tax=Phenylobacterium immobile TaxID=21 RepID=UPI000A6F7BEB|nr:ABC transporter substrate-binding protein [Phenylobacterium immobile]
MLRRSFLQASLALPLAAAACARPSDPTVLNVASQKGGTKSLMTSAGVLAGAPYRIEWSEFPAAQHLLEAVSAGAADLGGVGDAPFLFAFASSGRVRAVHASRSLGRGASTAILVKKISPARSIADLRGKRFATGRGSIGHYLLLYRLREAGLKPEDVTISFLTPADAKAAFSTGAIDAWSTWNSYIYLAARDDDARVLTDGRGALSGIGFQAANINSIETKRPLIADFLMRLSRAQRWSINHKDAYAAALAKETGMDKDIALQTAETGRGQPAPIDESVIAEESQVLATFRDAGVIASAPDIRQAFDASFNSAAI